MMDSEPLEWVEKRLYQVQNQPTRVLASNWAAWAHEKLFSRINSNGTLSRGTCEYDPAISKPQEYKYSQLHVRLLCLRHMPVADTKE